MYFIPYLLYNPKEGITYPNTNYWSYDKLSQALQPNEGFEAT